MNGQQIAVDSKAHRTSNFGKLSLPLLLKGRVVKAETGAPVRSRCVKGHTHSQTAAAPEPNQKSKGKGPWVIQFIVASWRQQDQKIFWREKEDG